MNINIDMRQLITQDNVERIDIEGIIPASISLYWHPVQLEMLSAGTTAEGRESVSGRALLHFIIDGLMGRRDAVIEAQKYEKPRVISGEPHISVSFSHTDRQVVAVVSEEFTVGVDIERLDRHVAERIGKRMKHPMEQQNLNEMFTPIQIWTMKEAALKAIGTGLRQPMNSICLTVDDRDLRMVTVAFPDGRKGTIHVTSYKNLTVSICYIRRQSDVTT